MFVSEPVGELSAKAFEFFFLSRRRHTRYWRDWSSEVCSSDLNSGACGAAGFFADAHLVLCNRRESAGGLDRKSVVKGKSVDLGGRRIIKKKKKKKKS